jgi:uncharacterized metal-binding protein
MPSGKNHDRITFFCLPCLFIASFILTQQSLLTFLVAGSFLFSGLMFGPDLDIYSVQFKRWGILRGLWLPYQKLFSHRSFFSHGFIIGTVIRICYLGSMALVIAILGIGIAQLIWGFPWNWQKLAISSFTLLTTVYQQESVAILIGLELGAMSHYLADGIVSRWQAWLKNKQKKKSLKVKRSQNKRKPLSKNKKKGRRSSKS